MRSVWRLGRWVFLLPTLQGYEDGEILLKEKGEGREARMKNIDERFTFPDGFRKFHSIS